METARCRGMAWSTEVVAQQTDAAAQAIGLTLASGSRWYDIDTADDLRVLYRDLRTARESVRAPRTLAMLHSMASKMGSPISFWHQSNKLICNRKAVLSKDATSWPCQYGDTEAYQYSRQHTTQPKCYYSVCCVCTGVGIVCAYKCAIIADRRSGRASDGSGTCRCAACNRLPILYNG